MRRSVPRQACLLVSNPGQTSSNASSSPSIRWLIRETGAARLFAHDSRMSFSSHIQFFDNFT
jgi:hypothetical protein